MRVKYPKEDLPPSLFKLENKEAFKKEGFTSFLEIGCR